MVGGAGSSIQSAHCTVHCTRAGILCSSALLDACLGFSSTQKMEAARSSETSVNLCRNTRRHIPGEHRIKISTGTEIETEMLISCSSGL
jgi:hypothetical protein